MASKFLIDIDLNGNEIQNFGIQTTGTLPASPFNGQVVNHSGVIKVYETSSTSWKYVGMAADGTTITESSGVISVGSIPQSSVTGLSTSLGGKVDDSQVLTNVPSGAVFTDTTYTGGTGIDLSGTEFAVDSTVVVTSGAQTIGGNKTFSDDVIVNGDLTVSGSVITKLSEQVEIEDNKLLLNSNETGTPSEDAGIEVERGTGTNVELIWREAADRWSFTNDGTNFHPIPVPSEYSTANDNDIDYISGATWDSASGSLELTGVGNAGATVNLDGRYLRTYSESEDFGTIKVSGQSDVTAGSIGDSVTFIGAGGMTITTASDTVTFTSANDNSIDYINGATFASGTLTLTGVGNAATSVSLDGRYLQSFTETDPVFVAHVANGITATQISNWDDAHGWGDHDAVGYLTAVPAAGIGAGTHGDAADGTKIDTITVDAQGRITAIATGPVVDNNTQRTDEEIEDVVGAMFSGNVESGLSVTYQDGTADIDIVTSHHTYTHSETSYAGGTLAIGGHNLDLAQGAVVQVYDVASSSYQQVATNVTLDTGNQEIKVVLPAGDWKIVAHGTRA
jgi:hypothetical protein